MGDDSRRPGSLVGRVIAGKLELTELLGSGSMGQVYRARHLTLHKPVAIKVMRTETAATPQQVGRFRAEAQANSRLDHPNIVQILDFGEDGRDRLLYIAMEHLDGHELSAVLARDGRLDEARACRILMQVCAALAAAHDNGVVHRDVKPGNIMLTRKQGDDGVIPDFVKVCDFGIAKLLERGADVEPLTLEGTALGTPAYASPEQVMGMEIDGRSDIYSCGIILHTLLAGRRPFLADSPMGVAMLQVSGQPPPLSSLRPDVNPELERVVAKAMAKRPEDRFANAREMRQALKRFIGIPLEIPGTGSDIYGMPSLPAMPPTPTAPSPTPGWISTATTAPLPPWTGRPRSSARGEPTRSAPRVERPATAVPPPPVGGPPPPPVGGPPPPPVGGPPPPAPRRPIPPAPPPPVHGADLPWPGMPMAPPPGAPRPPIQSPADRSPRPGPHPDPIREFLDDDD
jgi:serine/threonine protein kinase